MIEWCRRQLTDTGFRDVTPPPPFQGVSPSMLSALMPVQDVTPPSPSPAATSNMVTYENKGLTTSSSLSGFATLSRVGVIYCHSKFIVGQDPRLYNIPSEYMIQGHRYLDPPIFDVQRRLRAKRRHPDSQNPHL